MRYERTPRFKKEFQKFPKEVRSVFGKQLNFLLHDIRHPSLRAKKYDEEYGIWQIRITDNVRAYFCIEDDAYLFLNIRKHRD